MPNNPTTTNNTSRITRRTVLAAGGVAVAGVAGGYFTQRQHGDRAPVFVARHQSYDGPLTRTIRDGLTACDFTPEMFRGVRVLLKPNLVEPTRLVPHMTTHPAMILAAAEVFRAWGAIVTVGEAPGHVRDSEMALVESGVGEALHGEQLPFADLNYEQVGWLRNRGRTSTLEGIYLPKSVLEADLVVSMPKMKTHHWVGVTASMKNLYGVLPGIKYGWPKNVLHHHGIPQTVVDINATLPRTIAIIDGVDCMEGDGPILGTLKRMGLVMVGANLVATDATVSRIMGLQPQRISYLKIADGRLGSLAESRIEQRGEPWREVASPFQVLDEPHLRKLRATPDGPLVS